MKKELKEGYTYMDILLKPSNLDLRQRRSEENREGEG